MRKYSKTFVIIGGLLFIAFGLFHLTFFKVFSSANPDYSAIKPFLGKIMVMLNLGMVVFFISMGSIMLRFRNEITGSKLGRALLIMSCLFFIIRGIAEFAFPSYKIAFVLTMFVVSVVYFLPLLDNRR